MARLCGLPHAWGGFCGLQMSSLLDLLVVASIAKSSAQSYMKAEATSIFGPSRPGNTIEYGAKAENAIWGQRRKYKRRHMLKILAGHMIRPAFGRRHVVIHHVAR